MNRLFCGQTKEVSGQVKFYGPVYMGAATENIPIDNYFSLRRFSVNLFSLSPLIDFIILTLGLFMRNNEDPKSLETGRLPQMTTSLLPTLRNISGRVMAAETRGGMGRRGRGA